MSSDFAPTTLVSSTASSSGDKSSSSSSSPRRGSSSPCTCPLLLCFGVGVPPAPSLRRSHADTLPLRSLKVILRERWSFRVKRLRSPHPPRTRRLLLVHGNFAQHSFRRSSTHRHPLLVVGRLPLQDQVVDLRLDDDPGRHRRCHPLRPPPRVVQPRRSSRRLLPHRFRLLR